MVDLATRVMLGEKLQDLGYGTGLYPEAGYCAVKMPVFSFEKLTDVDTGLGPEMKSTGEVPGHCRELPPGAAEGVQGGRYEGAQEGRPVSLSPSRTRTRARSLPIAKGFGGDGH